VAQELVFNIGPDGVVRYIHSDEAVRLAAGALGRPVINRASHVEYDNERGGWTADMSPLGAPVILGPYTTREEALEREHTWLAAYMPMLPCAQYRAVDYGTLPAGRPGELPPRDST
jgi:hypothetical protein